MRATDERRWGHAAHPTTLVIDGPRGPDRVRPLREVLTATGAGLYLATHVAGPLPAETLAAVHESDEMELRVGRVGPDRAEDLDQRDKEARAVVAAALQASPDRVVLTHGVPDAVRALLPRLVDAPVDDGPARVVVVDGLAPAVMAALDAAAIAIGASVERAAEPPDELEGGVTLVVLPHVDRDGRRHDVAALATAAHEQGSRLLLDASLSVGAIPTEADQLSADAIVAETRHWLLGPEGVALAWLHPGLGDAAPDDVRAAAGAFSRGALLGLARSVGWLLMYVELPWAVRRTVELADQLDADLRAIDGVQLRADAAAHGALAAFAIEGWDAEAAAEELGRSVFAILDADLDADVLRVSVGAWNREEELDRFVGRVAELAAHTPETLPRKPSLTVISGPIDPPEDA
jgi:selenocysteine lyase/cysteine desulfurase